MIEKMKLKVERADVRRWRIGLINSPTSRNSLLTPPPHLAYKRHASTFRLCSVLPICHDVSLDLGARFDW